MKIALARMLWQNGSFVGDCATLFPITCEHMSGNSPRYAWIVPVGGCCGGGSGYQLTMGNPNPAATEAASDVLNANAGILKGVWVEGNGTGALYDIDDPATLIDFCNACCDGEEEAELATRYDGTFPSVADIEPTVFTITRADNGTAYDLQRARLDYLGQHIEGTFNRTAYDGTDSTYTFQARGDAHAIGEDTVAETARVFDSNSLAAPAGGSHYVANATINGTPLTELSTTGLDTIANIVTLIGSTPEWNDHGTWSAASASVLRLTSTTANTATIVLTIIAD